MVEPVAGVLIPVVHGGAACGLARLSNTFPSAVCTPAWQRVPLHQYRAIPHMQGVRLSTPLRTV